MTTIFAVDNVLMADTRHGDYMDQPHYFSTKIGRSETGDLVVALGGTSQTPDHLNMVATRLSLVLATDEMLLKRELTDDENKLRSAGIATLESLWKDKNIDKVFVIRKLRGEVKMYLMAEGTHKLETIIRPDGVSYGSGFMAAKVKWYHQKDNGLFDPDGIMDFCNKIDEATTGKEIVYGESLNDMYDTYSLALLDKKEKKASLDDD